VRKAGRLRWDGMRPDEFATIQHELYAEEINYSSIANHNVKARRVRGRHPSDQGAPKEAQWPSGRWVGPPAPMYFWRKDSASQ
jgi:hypothetical protein